GTRGDSEPAPREGCLSVSRLLPTPATPETYANWRPSGRRRPRPPGHVPEQDGETGPRGAERDQLAPSLPNERVRLRPLAEVEEAPGAEELGLNQRRSPRVDLSGQQFLRSLEERLAFDGPTRGTEGHSSCLGRDPLRPWELRQTRRPRVAVALSRRRESLVDV